jgi:glycosyltransferase involved in cell wall biosynthesis
MRICFIVSTYPPTTIGGQGEVVLRLRKQLADYGVEAYVFTSGATIEGYTRTKRTGCGKRLFYAVSAAYLNWFRKMDFDIVNIHGESGMCVAPFLAARKRHTKLVTTLHTCFLDESAALGAIRVDGDVIARPTVDEYLTRYLLTPVKFFGNQVDLKVADRVIAVCEKTKQECIRQHRIPAEKVSVIHNGVDLETFNPSLPREPMRERHCIGESPALLSVGCSTIRKGIFLLLRSLKDVKVMVPDVRLIVVGGTNYLSRMMSVASGLGVRENVIFAGNVPNETLPYYYSACDVMVLPSLQEGFPVVMLEAIASGKPVVASRVGGVPEGIRSGENGMLFSPGNVGELSGSILALLQNAALRKRMGEQGRRIAEKKYDWRNIGREYMREFESLVC